MDRARVCPGFLPEGYGRSLTRREKSPIAGMAVHSIPSFSAPLTPVGGAKDRRSTPEVAATGAVARDDVRVSERAQVLSRLAADVDPTPDSLRRRASQLAEELGKELRGGGIDAGQPFAFDVDAAEGTVRVRDARPDGPAIDTILARRPDLVARIRDVAVLQRHVESIEASTGVVAAQRATRDSAEASGLIARFAPAPSGGDPAAGFAVIQGESAAAWTRQLRAASAYSAVAGEIDVARLAPEAPRADKRGRGGSPSRDGVAD